MQKKESQPKDYENIADILPRVLKDLGISKYSGAKIKKIEQLWREIVGEPLASQTKVLKYYRKKLHVGVASSAWMQEARALDEDKIKDAFMSAEEPFFIAGIKYTVI